ncbi:hypothetical protein ACQ4PT_014143 [Festuca glaucescens]
MSRISEIEWNKYGVVVSPISSHVSATSTLANPTPKSQRPQSVSEQTAVKAVASSQAPLHRACVLLPDATLPPTSATAAGTTTTTTTANTSPLAAMGTRLFLLLLLAFLFSTPSPAAASPHISAVISQPGLDFAKDLLVPRATETLAQLSVPDIEQSVYIPLIGTVRMVASDIVLEGVTVADSTVAAGDTGVVVAASFSSVNLTMRWSYSYDSWFVTISDSGNASIQVEGMDVGVSMGMKNENGSLKLFVTECACYMKDLDITLSGGSSWFYQVFIDGFSNHIRSSVENAITNKITEGASKLDLFLESIPKEIYVDKVATVNVTFVNDPLFKSSSVQFDIDGLFIPSDKTALSKHIHFGDTKFAQPLGSSSNMLWISLD